jgi:hypothetical protein
MPSIVAKPGGQLTGIQLAAARTFPNGIYAFIDPISCIKLFVIRQFWPIRTIPFVTWEAGSVVPTR